MSPENSLAPPLRLTFFREQSGDTLAHLSGGFVGKSHCQNSRRIHAMMLDESCDAHCEHARFSRSSARDN